MAQRFCPNCGGELQFQEAEICPKCGVRIKEPPMPVQDKYAGFWIRFGAYLIDGIICAVVVYGSLFIVILLGAALTPGSYSSYYSPYSSSNYAAMGLLFILWFIFIIIFTWLYYAYQESSPAQATLGKQAVGIIVTDTEGNRISLGKATGRWLAKILSALILCIGFIMIGFTDQKQGLHDMIASTRVVYKNR
jgi:uncharacterized RDD family membrane protein YckC